MAGEKSKPAAFKPKAAAPGRKNQNTHPYKTRVGHPALGSRVEIKLVRRKGSKVVRRRGGGGKVKTRSL